MGIVSLLDDTNPIDDSDLRFDDAVGVDNPIAIAHVAALRGLRSARVEAKAYRDALFAALELLHVSQRELVQLRQRNSSLVDELRTFRKDAAA